MSKTLLGREFKNIPTGDLVKLVHDKHQELNKYPNSTRLRMEFNFSTQELWKRGWKLEYVTTLKLHPPRKERSERFVTFRQKEAVA
jgi:hypothetical protein